MRILSRNVAGINNPARQHQIINYCRKFDISMLQETKLTTQNTAFLKNKWGSDHVYLSSPGTARRGVVTLVHPRLSPVVLLATSDPHGQYYINLLSIKDSNYLVLNIYGCPDTDASALATMKEVTDKLEDIHTRFTIDHIIIGGDFNFVMEDRDTRSTSRKPRAEAQFLTIMNIFDLYDVAALHTATPLHTYFRHRRENTSARYDRFYVTPGLLQGIRYKILKRTGDHAPIELGIMNQQHSANWRFSDSLLSDPQFLEALHNTISEALTHYSTSNQGGVSNMQNFIDFQLHDSSLIFSTIVNKVRKFCMKETKTTGIKKKEAEKKAIDEFIVARDSLNNSNPPSNDQINTYETAQQRLQLLQARRHQAAADRNFSNYATLGERTSRYHFARSNRGKPSREIPRLVISTPAGQTVLEGSEVQQHLFQKYADLTKPDPQACTMTIEQFLGPDLVQTLRKCPPESHSYLTSPVLEVEVKNIVKDLKMNSAPGPLGFSNALIKEVAPFITSILAHFGNDLLFGESPTFLPWFFHRFVIFILKSGKPTTDPDSYRGLSMLEGFFKIFSKALANRMQSPMRHIQNPHQFGFTANKGTLEASRTVLDAIHHAKLHNLPLLLISTDFFKAFDSIAIQHIENCLNLYQFPEPFVKAFMRLANNGSVQFDVNSVLSQDHPVQKGTGQGDPKSSFGFNLSAAPLNHYLSTSPTVPRFKQRNEDVPPVYFADDAMLLLQGDQIDLVIETLQKISEYYHVAGLKLNVSKCEILPVNCREEDITRLLSAVNMKRVTTLKHLGIHIDSNGNLPHDKNIAPLQQTMSKISDSFNSSLSSPLGRSIYAKFLLSSKYLHRIQNFHFTDNQLDELRKTVLRLTWTRSRPQDDAYSVRVHIAQDRVAQPLYYGGLSVPHPVIQSKALTFSWARKLCNPNHALSWTMMLEALLLEHRRPTISQHVTMGPTEWQSTATSISTSSPFWAYVFSAIGTIMELSHQYDKHWALIPIIGYEESPVTNDISSLSSQNRPALNLHQAGLRLVGQLFHTNLLGHVVTSNVKTFEALEAEFDVSIPIILRNSISTLVQQIKLKYRDTISTSSSLFETVSTLQSLLRVQKSGCGQATRLLLQHQRSHWDWGQFPRSYATYTADNMVNISSREFSKALARSRSNPLPPSIQWTSIAVFLRTLWTNVKEARTARNQTRQAPIDQTCSNCGLSPERTIHLLYQCPLAQQVWTYLIDEINTLASLNNPTHSPIQLTSDLVLFNHTPNNLQDQMSADLLQIVMTVKHLIYRFKFRENLNRFPTVRLSLLTAALELDKTVMVRQRSGLDSQFLENMVDKIKTRVGM